MQSTGESEQSSSTRKQYTLTFWQNFLLTLFGAAGLISMVADGPRWITYPALVVVIVLLLWVIKSATKNRI